jgi:HNH endonuclease
MIDKKDSEVPMNDHDLCERLRVLVTKERQITNEILQLINLIQERRAYLSLGFSSIYDLLVKGMGYSSSSVFRRIEAAKVLRAVPVVKEKLETGKINLTTLSKAQTVMKAQERLTGEKLSIEFKEEVIKEIENKTTEEAERSLLALMPEVKPQLNQERRKIIDDTITRHTMNFSKEMTEDLTRLKEIFSHKFPNASDAQIVGHALKFLLEKADPLKKSGDRGQKVTAATAASRVKRVTLQRDGGACTFRDPKSGKVCGSRYQVEVDHIIPKALGGKDAPENLRVLCRQHNLLMAERIFGREHMVRFRKT